MTTTLRLYSAAVVGAVLATVSLLAVARAGAPASRASDLMLSAAAAADATTPAAAQPGLVQIVPVEGPAGASVAPAPRVAPTSAARVSVATDRTPRLAQASPTTPEVRMLQMTVTAYCPCSKCCGEWADGITASGAGIKANRSRFVAADTARLPFHTRLIIPGYDGGKAVPVLDRGGAIKGNRLDVFFPTHREALQWGVKKLTVTVLDEG